VLCLLLKMSQRVSAQSILTFATIMFVNLKDGGKAWIGQPHLFKMWEKKFGTLVENLQSHKTPGTPEPHLFEFKMNWQLFLLKIKLSTNLVLELCYFAQAFEAMTVKPSP